LCLIYQVFSTTAIHKRLGVTGPTFGIGWVSGVNSGDVFEILGVNIPAGTYKLIFGLDNPQNDLGSTDGGSTTITSDGLFSAGVVIPAATSTGTHTIFVSFTGVDVSDVFKAELQIYVCNPTAYCNQTIAFLDQTTYMTRKGGSLSKNSYFTLVGQGFRPGEEVQIWLDRWQDLPAIQFPVRTHVNTFTGAFQTTWELRISDLLVNSTRPIAGFHVLSAVSETTFAGSFGEAAMWVSVTDT
jgi:hypothetical protein